MTVRRNQIAGLAGLAALAALTGVAAWRAGEAKWGVWRSEPAAVMGTNTKLTVVARAGSDVAPQALAAAEAALRRAEVLMSWRLDGSEVSAVNAASPGEFVELSPETLEVLKLSKRIWRESGGAFDVTCFPIIALWAKAGRVEPPEARRVPGPEALAAAREASSWKHFAFQQAGVTKSVATARIDLGGIAKGYAIDRALEAIRAAGAAGGLVDVGGDIRCFGRPAQGGRWTIDIRDPFGSDKPLTTLSLSAAAVCTSGHYARHSEIEGRRYSHIVDPRPDGRQPPYSPLRAETAPASVTVIAPTAATADAWATALAVLGPGGLHRAPTDRGVEALLVVGSPESPRMHMTPGFAAYAAVPKSLEPAPLASPQRREGQ